MKVTNRLIVRTTPELRARLERIVARRRLGQMSDHIRLALEEYVERHEHDGGNELAPDGDERVLLQAA